MTLFETGIRPKIDIYLEEKSNERRDYGEYWSASSAGYCMKKNIFDRLQVPFSSGNPRKQRVFEAGHIFHEWIQRITKDAGLSIAQECELQDDSLMVKGHIDDLVLVENALILYDYKTQNSRAFTWQKNKPMSHFRKMQLGTYIYLLRNNPRLDDKGLVWPSYTPENIIEMISELNEGRILKISKDDLRMDENVLNWSPEVESRVKTYWRELNEAWKRYKQSGALPPCTCADRENGFMASEKYNPYFYNGEPCSTEWFKRNTASLS
jgi:hypothetical protein